VVDHLKIFFSSSLFTVQNLVTVYRSMYAHVERPKNLGDAGAPSP